MRMIDTMNAKKTAFNAVLMNPAAVICNYDEMPEATGPEERQFQFFRFCFPDDPFGGISINPDPFIPRLRPRT
jgi:hypothetical protein